MFDASEGELALTGFEFKNPNGILHYFRRRDEDPDSLYFALIGGTNKILEDPLIILLRDNDLSTVLQHHTQFSNNLHVVLSNKPKGNISHFVFYEFVVAYLVNNQLEIIGSNNLDYAKTIRYINKHNPAINARLDSKGNIIIDLAYFVYKKLKG